MSPDEVHKALNAALNNSLEWARKHASILSDIKSQNSRRSAYFASECCKQLDPLVSGEPHFIKVPCDPTLKKVSGELLLDGLWTQDICLKLRDPHATQPIQVPSQIRCAFECESSTRGDYFFKDFSKLLLVSSAVKIFAGGLNQRKRNAAGEYVTKRMEQIKKLLANSPKEQAKSNWYIAFWPSPKKVDEKSESLWDQLCDGFSHLNKIRLFERPNCENFEFQEHF